MNAAAQRKTWWWVLVALAASCALCGGAAALVVVLGLASDGAGGSSPGATTADVTFAPPAEFRAVSEGRWRAERVDGDARHTVELIRLPSISGSDGVQALGEGWRSSIVPDWPKAPARVLPLRRFAENGARVFFTSAALRAPDRKHDSLVSLYLVQADDRFEPFVTVQEVFDDSVGAMLTARGSFDFTHPLVEALFKGVSGSPAGAALVDATEVVGRWRSASGASIGYVNVITGATGYQAAASLVRYQFTDDGRFTYRFSGTVTDTGSTTFRGQDDEGTWRVERDLLLLDGETLKKKFFVVGAGLGPHDKRVLYLMPEGHWTLSPNALTQEGLLLEEDEE